MLSLIDTFLSLIEVWCELLVLSGAPFLRRLPVSAALRAFTERLDAAFLSSTQLLREAESCALLLLKLLAPVTLAEAVCFMEIYCADPKPSRL